MCTYANLVVAMPMILLSATDHRSTSEPPLCFSKSLRRHSSHERCASIAFRVSWSKNWYLSQLRIGSLKWSLLRNRDHALASWQASSNNSIDDFWNKVIANWMLFLTSTDQMMSTEVGQTFAVECQYPGQRNRYQLRSNKEKCNLGKIYYISPCKMPIF